MKRIYLNLSGILALVFIAATAQAKETLVVGTDKVALETAIAASQSGDVILISASISLDSKLSITKAGLYFKGVGDGIAIQPTPSYTERVVELVPGAGNTLTFENLTFTGANNLGNATGNDKDGGFGRVANGNVEFIDCKITDNYTLEHGAAFDLYGGSTTFTTCEISGNRSGKNGGALRVRTDGTQLILRDGTVFTGNQSGERGAALYAQDGSITTITDSEITTNTSPTSDGGAFATTNSAQLSISNSEVSGNSTTGSARNGGAFWLGGTSTTTIDNCEIKNNTVVGRGGAIYAESGKQLTITRTKITGNQSTATGGATGGAFDLQSSIIVNISDCEISGNKTPDRGGALAVRGTAKVTISDCEITGNKTTGSGDGGGAFFLEGTPVLTINNCEIAGNESTGTGGAFRVAATSSLIINNSTVTGNKTTVASKQGGAFFLTGSSTTNINNSEISNNETIDRGAAFWGEGNNEIPATLNIKGSKVNGNKATANGGAFFITQKFTATIENSEITNSETADRGGAFYSEGTGPLNIRHSKIAGNKTITATGDRQGGAFFLSGSSITNIDTCEISNNKTPDRGGAFWSNSTAKLNIRGSKILGNSAFNRGAAFGTDGTSTVKIYNSLIKGNSIRIPVKDDAGNFVLDGGRLQVYSKDGLSYIICETASGEGGNGAAFAMTGSQTLYVESSSIVENESFGQHGGLVYTENSPTMSFVNTTIANNKMWRGGDSMFFLTGNGGTFNFINTTVAGNSSGSLTFGPDGGASTAIMIREKNTRVHIINSIFAGNSTRDGKAGDLKFRDKFATGVEDFVVADAVEIKNSIIGFIIGIDDAKIATIPGIATSNYNAYIQNNSANFAWKTTDKSGINWDKGLYHTADGTGFYPVVGASISGIYGDPAFLSAALEAGTPLTDQLGFARPGTSITAGAIEYQAIQDLVVAHTDEKTVEDYAYYHKNILFTSPAEATGQLTVPAGGLALQNEGAVKVVKTFIPHQWYPIGFPFAVDKITAEFGGGVEELEYYDGTTTTNGTTGDFYLKSLKADGSGFDFATSLEAGKGYIIQFPDDFEDVPVTFSSGTGHTLLTSSSDFTPAVTADYSLVVNPSTVNVNTLNAVNAYYTYNASTNKFDRIDQGETSYDLAATPLKPFEALIVASPSVEVSALRSIIGEADNDGTTHLTPASIDSKVIATQYYTLQGIETAKPTERGVYFVKTTYASQRVATSKINHQQINK
ncbi:MAG: hypothetical protein EZS26_001414 [Candidatus Ordinivivax streblomastigis]|uniref:Right handed beta helix domain-containing protein n=1 Tax=Candidatus Ordinivivax streblomastigis TaxID=2540710 RepID=A0A5M8P1K3_9BACT|nr:MAG: hypothetical protein EZS26_001414 [Candidatus Ordinivivax streblomastigis]